MTTRTHRIGPRPVDIAVWAQGCHGTPKARVLFVHGLGEHGGRHLPTMESLASRGFETVRFDLRGCGESGGPRQWINRFSDYIDDTSAVINWVKSDLTPLPLFLFGHSLGGTIGSLYASEHPEGLSGLILSAPGYLAGAGVSALKLRVARLVGLFAPRVRVPATLDATTISRDPAEVERYRQDPLNCAFNTVRQGTEIMDTIPNLPKVFPRLKLPVLILHGDADRLVRCEGSRELFALLPGPDKTLEIFPGGYHELHNDLDREKFFSVIADWLDARVSSSSRAK